MDSFTHSRLIEQGWIEKEWMKGESPLWLSYDYEYKVIHDILCCDVNDDGDNGSEDYDNYDESLVAGLI